MLHTANIDVSIVTVVITFNCATPAKSVTQTYGPGSHTDPDECSTSFISATIAGTDIEVGSHATLTLDGKVCRVDVSASDGGRHITVDVSYA